MRPASSPSALTQSLIVVVLSVALRPLAATAAQPAPPSPAAAGCQWTYYPISDGQLQPEQLLYDDPDDTPITDLSVGNPFRANATFTGSLASLASTGSTDFDGDDRTDVFRTVPRSDGNLQWQYSSAGAASWQDLAYATSLLPASQLQFGEFDGDLATDVFADLYDNGSHAYQWLSSSGGTNSFVLLNSMANFVDRLALGDFDGDGLTDVFTATQQSATEQWSYYPGGTAAPIALAYAATDPTLLRFGDFDGDGRTDVFAGARQPDGSVQWLYSSGGADSYTSLVTSTVPYSELQFGDFDGDGRTDVLAALPQADGGLQVVYWPGGLGSGVPLGHIAAPAPALRVGDFDGDGISDLLALRCGMPGPLSFGPLQTLATSGYGTFHQSLAGDVNGDGRPDVVLVSTCQNPSSLGFCASHHLQVGSALATPAHTFTLVAPQQLGADSLDFTYAKVLAGDFDGDGRMDLALVTLLGSNLTITIARSDGDGHFTLGAPQTFGGEANWSDFNPVVGDFDGDGKDDLALTTVCHFAGGSCSVGDDNVVYVATSGGASGFTLSARHVLGASGWTDFEAWGGDFNGDGKTDLVFNSTCQKTNFVDATCTVGDANIVYTALSDGSGGFTLSGPQSYGASGWSDYPVSHDLVGDVDGDGRTDLVWSSSSQAGGASNNLVVVGYANPDGTFGLGSTQDFGSAWRGALTLADLDHDGRADLLWNRAPANDTDVDTYAAALSRGRGAFESLGKGAVYTSRGTFQIPESDDPDHVPTRLLLVSTRQDSISDALFVVDAVPEPDAPWLGAAAGLALLLQGRRAPRAGGPRPRSG